ncbi:protein FAM204A isoform X2 [Tachysurus fulvidraco]|uniref:protein FAM204A isoform X2 n=1 Tax=Tachysurus fulvidraco TaxID=1234273 RepID=UPI001FEF665C|nr:protein FAM204A isoform X2 [Tachysurus fulvidraco]
MYSGLLPKGLSEADLSPDEEEENTDEDKTRTGTETEKCPAESDQNVQNDSSSSSSSSSCPDNCLPGVSQDLWHKFKDLQKERETQKMDKPPVRKRGKKRHRNGGAQKQKAAEEKRDDEEVRMKKWEDLTQYFGTNDRFQPPPCSRPSPKSGLEKSMERAIAEGDYGKAEELSDRLATREVFNTRNSFFFSLRSLIAFSGIRRNYFPPVSLALHPQRKKKGGK